MPKVTLVTTELAGLMRDQDGVVTTQQLMSHGFSPDSIQRRVSRGAWQWLLQGVVLTVSGEPTRRQRVIGAWLWAGGAAAVDGVDACHWYGVKLPRFRPSRVHLVVPNGFSRRSQAFVRVRRSIAEIPIGETGSVPYVSLPVALVVAARDARSVAGAIDVLSRGLQTNRVSVAALRSAREVMGDKWCGRTDAALLAVGAGPRSVAECDFRSQLSLHSRLPQPLWNQWLDLGDGGSFICVDALWPDAGLVHETNGRAYHAWGLTFEEMQTRHDRLTVAGLVVLHNAATRIRRSGAAVMREVEATYQRNAGRGMPTGVRLLDPPANCA